MFQNLLQVFNITFDIQEILSFLDIHIFVEYTGCDNRVKNILNLQVPGYFHNKLYTFTFFWFKLKKGFG